MFVKHQQRNLMESNVSAQLELTAPNVLLAQVLEFGMNVLTLVTVLSQRQIGMEANVFAQLEHMDRIVSNAQHQGNGMLPITHVNAIFLL